MDIVCWVKLFNQLLKPPAFPPCNPINKVHSPFILNKNEQSAASKCTSGALFNYLLTFTACVFSFIALLVLTVCFCLKW